MQHQKPNLAYYGKAVNHSLIVDTVVGHKRKLVAIIIELLCILYPRGSLAVPSTAALLTLFCVCLCVCHCLAMFLSYPRGNAGKARKKRNSTFFCWVAVASTKSGASYRREFSRDVGDACGMVLVI